MKAKDVSVMNGIAVIGTSMMDLVVLCRQAMEMLGQTIRIDSREGEGTRVYLGLSGSLSKM